jgi:hypothetical protein
MGRVPSRRQLSDDEKSIGCAVAGCAFGVIAYYALIVSIVVAVAVIAWRIALR